MNGSWPVLLGITGTLLGGLLGHFYAMRAQQMQWRRDDVLRQETRQHAQKLDFRVDVRFVSVHLDDWIVEVIALLDNKGAVQYETSKMEFDLRALLRDDPLAPGGEEIGRQIDIPHLMVTGSWLPATWSHTFIEPGLTTRYSFVAAVPRLASVVLLHGRVEYASEIDVTHTAEAIVAVPPSD